MASDERDEIETQLASLKKEFEEGELTQKGYRRKSTDLNLKLLDIEYNEGELTEQGLAKKKARLEKEVQSAATVPNQRTSSSSGIEIADKLKQSKMTTAITKLFGRDRQMIKKGVVSSKNSKESKLYKLEIICLDYDSNEVPRGSVRNALPKAVLQFLRSESEVAIRHKVHQLFPEIFKTTQVVSGGPQYYYCKAVHNKLNKMTLPPPGFVSWSGNALINVCGQGSLYIIPTSVDHKSMENQASSTNVVMKSKNSSFLTQGLLNYIKKVEVPVTIAGPTPVTQDDMPPNSYDLAELVDEACDPHVGGLILELAELKDTKFSPSSPEEGYTNLYAVNPEVYQWISWREMHQRPLKKPWKRSLYLKLDEEEMTDFLKFRDSLRCVQSPEEINSFLLPSSKLIITFLKKNHLHDFPLVKKYVWQTILFST